MSQTSLVYHYVRVYGRKNQPYTENLLKQFQQSNTSLDHTIICEQNQVQKQPWVIVLKSKVSVRTIFFLLKIWSNTSLKKSTGHLKFKQKIKFLLKWRFLLIHPPQVLHIHHLQGIDVGMLSYLKLRGVKIIASLRGRDILVNSLDPNQKAILNQKISYIDSWHAISKYMQTEARLIFNIDAKVIYRGVDFPLVTNLKSSSNGKDKIITILAVGRLVWEKGHLYLLDAIYKLKLEGYTIHLDIYGSGNLKEALVHRIRQLDLANEVSLKGHIPLNELRGVYKNYDLAVQSSLSEALSNGLLDMAVHQLPCVISNVGGMQEIITNGVNGIIYDVKEPNSLTKAIIDCLNLNFDVLVSHNKLIYKQTFSTQIEIDNLEKQYLNLLS